MASVAGLQVLLHPLPPRRGPSTLSLKMYPMSLIFLMLWTGVRFPQEGNMQTLCCYQAGDASCWDARVQCISVVRGHRTRPTEVFPEGLIGRETAAPEFLPDLV